MDQLALLLKILETANLSTPVLVGIIGSLKSNADSGKTDEQIIEEALATVAETKTITDHDRSDEV